MRTVGERIIAQPSSNPSAEGLARARIHQTTGASLAAVSTTGIAKGVYRYATHELMNRATEEALTKAIALNIRARRVAPTASGR